MPEPENERQCLVLHQNADPALAATGLGFITIEHDGCAQESEPEAYRVRQLYQNLLAQHWTDRDGRVRPIEVGDILVVSPYNMVRTRCPRVPLLARWTSFRGRKRLLC
jgi:hypothetical protein